jgi:O-acetyl-ADP-ribose deacetylase (regulator of RNase III)
MNNRLFKIGVAGLYIAVGACTEFVYALDTMFDNAVEVQMEYEKERDQLKQRKDQEKIDRAPAAPKVEKEQPAYFKDWKERMEERRWQEYQNRQDRRNANRDVRNADSSAARVSWWDRFWGKKPQKIEPSPSKDTSSTIISYDFCNVKVQLMFGNIAEQADVDAIVNAGNPELSNGLGVTGAIWKAAGPELDEYIEKNIPADKNGVRCPTGQVRVTPGFNLKAPWIIHAVGPRGENPNRAELLKRVYGDILYAYAELGSADKRYAFYTYKWRTLAIPMISTGIYGYPREEATQIAVNEIVAWAQANQKKEVTIRFVFFNDQNGQESFELYKKLFGQACSRGK